LLTVRDLSQALSSAPEAREVAELIQGGAALDLDAFVGGLMADEAVPSATCQAYSDEGIEKRRLWEQTWDLQRREDAGEKVTIEVPPKYEQDDFQNKGIVWRHRGKLDVPKERFIAYPTATPPPGTSGKAGLVFGWAGWNHLEQLQAVIALWQDEWNEHGQKLVPKATRAQREAEVGEAAVSDPALAADASTREKLLPLLQTMVDLLPWVRQWHNEDGETADQFEGYVAEESRKLEMSPEEVHLWRLPKQERRKRAPRVSAPRAVAPAITEEQVLQVVREAAAGTLAIEASAVAERLGVAQAKIKPVLDALVTSGRLVETKKRPRTLQLG
jgi:hypothetical protein